jgi:peptidoglycan/xylan/chitin deacetylase (PgdA/CDA1 family)
MLGAICAALAVLPAIGGLTGDRRLTPPAAAPSLPASSAAPAVVVASSPPPTAPPAPVIHPVGWKLTDLPSFPPPPVPEPIVLPPGDSVPYLSRLPVTQPVAFITIDDGYLKLPEAEKLLAAAHVPVTLFLTTDAIRDDVAYFDRLRASGAVIEAHTITHAGLRGRSAQSQRRELCGSADRLGEWYGRRPVLFRPPYGEKDDTTLRVAQECGLRAGFFWTETVHKGKVRYQAGHRVQPGDIILMHFRPAFVDDFIAALKAIHRAGLTPALLEDYLPA